MKKLFLIAIICTFNFHLIAQITIGSLYKPSKGAILDLKEENKSDGSQNSSKGLLLPRLYLKSQKSLDDINPTNTTRPDNEDHTGLMVYNTNVCFGYGAGAYLWNGAEWIALKPPYTGTGLVQDEEGNEYRTMDFGPAGIWMTENLRSTKFPSGTANGDELSNTFFTESTKKAAYLYPAISGNSGIGSSDKNEYLEKQPSIGLLYNWYAASNYRIIRPNNLSSYGEQYKADQEIIQGICPNGWHIPSDYEWTMLEKEIANNPEKYSAYSKDDNDWIEWNKDWETYRVDLDFPDTSIKRPQGQPAEGKSHANAMKTACEEIPGYTPPQGNIAYGKSRNTFEGGLNIVFAGSFDGDNGKTRDYGTRARFWTSSFASNRTSDSKDWIMTRVFIPNDASVILAQQTQHWGFSIRCIKNNM